MTWLTGLQFKLPFLGFPPPPERRSELEIENDLEDEFNFHIEQAARDLIAQGSEPQAAQTEARVRFGDLSRIKSKCKRIALEERIMLQRVNFIMMAVVMVLVLAMGIQLIFTQRANTSALQGITAQLAKIKTVAGGDEGSNGTFVLVQGDVERPGWYPIVVGSGATYLSDVIQRAGLIEADSMIRVDRKSGEATIQFNTSSSDLATRYGKFVMVPGAEIQVTRRPPHQRSLDPADDFNFTAVGHWLQVDKDGKPVIDGATLDIIAPEDIRNLKGVMLGTLKFPGIDDQLEMSFSDQNGSVGTLQIELHRPGTIKGRWEFANRMLRVNLTALASFSTAMPNQHPFMNQPAVMSQLSELLEFVHAPREAANATASAPDAQSQH